MDEAKYYNALNVALQSEYPNYPDLRRLFEEHKSWRGAWQSGSYKANPEKEWQKLEEHGVRLILKDDPEFPPLLKEIPWPPFGIYVKGNLRRSQDLRLAIVGTRKATKQGMEFAEKIGGEFARLGITVVSGLALGIDESAHKGAVDANGKSVAVLAVGLERVYPAQNKNLADKILECGGVLVSEYPIGSSSYPTRFIERNRIISGLSRGIIVVEAPEKSGALATAKFAVDQNRDVFVVPGPASHTNYVGSFKLIRDGARLVNSVEDVLEDLNLEVKKSSRKHGADKPELDKEQALVYEVLENAGSPTAIDKISESSKLDIRLTSRVLAFLVLRGIVREDGGKYYIT